MPDVDLIDIAPNVNDRVIQEKTVLSETNNTSICSKADLDTEADVFKLYNSGFTELALEKHRAWTENCAL